RVQRRQLGELDPRFGIVEHHAVNRVDAYQRIELFFALALARLTHLADDGIALAQTAFAHHRHGHIHVVLTGQISRGTDKGVIVQNIDDARRGHENIVLAYHRLGVWPPTAAAIAVAAVAPSARIIVMAVVLIGLLSVV